MSDQVLVNARYLHHRVSGVQRYAHEVVSRLGQRVNLFSPKCGGTGVFGHIWEQVILPLEIGKRNLLWSPANTGPLTSQNQVVTIHDLCVIDHPEWYDPKFSAWYRFLLPRLVERVIKVITDSDYSRDRILELFSLQKDRVVAIPLGVDSRFRPTPQEYIDVVRSKYGIEKDYLAVIGSLQPRKNLARLFQAWKQIHPNYKSLQLVVVGGTGHTFRDAGFRELPRGVNLTGYIKDTDLPMIYSGALAFVLPSLYEGFGLPLLEAMACGTPVICSNTTSLPEVVANAGILVDPYDPKAIAYGIQQMVEDHKLRNEFHQLGLNRAKQFTWEKTSDEIWKVLLEAKEKIA